MKIEPDQDTSTVGLEARDPSGRENTRNIEYNESNPYHDITLFISITMFFGTDIILRNISSFGLNVRNIPHNIVNCP